MHSPLKRIAEFRKIAEAVLGFSVPDSVVEDTLNYSVEKLQYIRQRQPEYKHTYLPLLFENEIRDYYMRTGISNY